MDSLDGVTKRPTRRSYEDRPLPRRPLVMEPRPVSKPTSASAEVPKKVHPGRRFKLRYVLIPAIFIVLAVGLLGLLLALHPGHHSKATADGLPAVALQQVSGFKAYYFDTNPTNFSLVTSSVTYQAGVLIFSMRNPQATSLAFTEEAVPSGFDISALNADKQFKTEYGEAYVTDALDRTTGALFTSDNTWILINAPTPIGADLMTTILNALTPVQ